MAVDRMIDVNELRPGMYITRLDRPWLQTPFPLQGFRPETWSQVHEVRALCEYVYVETSEEAANNAEGPAGGTAAADKTSGGHVNVRIRDFMAHTSQESPALQTGLRQEVSHALPLVRETRKLTLQLFKNARMGRSIDTRQARESVSALTDSVLRNPYALLWLAQLKTKDEYTFYHSLSVCAIALAVGRQMGLQRSVLEELGLGAFLHDIGKMRIPAHILQKETPLDADERSLLRRHPRYGVEIVDAAPNFPGVSRDIIYGHHERIDGSGYMEGITGDQIAPLTHLVAICDTYDAVTSERPYKAAISSVQAMSLLNAERGKRFDNDMVQRFIQSVGIYPVGTLLELSTGEAGMVTRVNPKARLRPQVLVLTSSEGGRLKKPKTIDLSKTGEDASGSSLTVARAIRNGAYGIDTGKLAQKLAEAA